MNKTPDRTEPFVGWRLWLVHESDHIAPLRSVSRTGTRWQPFIRQEAECCCEQIYPQIRDSEHKCGLYAAHNLWVLRLYYPSIEAWKNRLPPRYVIGRVSLWGRVMTHDPGVYRAQYAYPASFACFEDSLHREVVEALAAAYGVGVETVVSGPRGWWARPSVERSAYGNDRS